MEREGRRDGEREAERERSTIPDLTPKSVRLGVQFSLWLCAYPQLLEPGTAHSRPTINTFTELMTPPPPLAPGLLTEAPEIGRKSV